MTSHLLPPAAFIALCFPALSQADSDKKAAADTLIVTAKQAESPTGPVNGYIATRSSTATKTDTPLIETPQAISVVSRAEITAHNAQSVAEALRYTSGILQTNGAASQRFDSLNIRGFDISSTGMLRDGLRSTTAQAWPKAEPYGLERIEVLRGPSSVLLSVLFWVDWRLALVALIPLPLAILLQKRIMAGYSDRQRDFNQSVTRTDNAMLEFLNALPVMKAFRRDAESFQQLERALENQLSLVAKVTGRMIIGWTAFVTVSQSSLILVLPLRLSCGSTSSWLCRNLLWH